MLSSHHDPTLYAVKLLQKLIHRTHSTELEIFVLVIACDLSLLKVRNEKAAQRVSSGAGYPADVRADIRADVWGQSLVRPSKSWESKPVRADIHDPEVRTSMTPERSKSFL